MGSNVEPMQPLTGVEAINPNSALHKALAEMQHWQRCARELQKKLNTIEDRTTAMRVWRFAALSGAALNILFLYFR